MPAYIFHFKMYKGYL